MLNVMLNIMFLASVVYCSPMNYTYELHPRGLHRSGEKSVLSVTDDTDCIEAVAPHMRTRPKELLLLIYRHSHV